MIVASRIETTCPNCGGPAYWHADDGITWCQSKTCGPQVAPGDENYRPPDRRGGRRAVAFREAYLMPDTSTRPDGEGRISSPYRRCPTCNEWSRSDRHTCAPAWDWRSFWAPGQAGEWVIGEIYARDAEDAATAAARAYDADDYPLSSGGDVEIEVRRTGSEETSRWHAKAESEPVYYVNEVDGDPAHD